MTDFLFRTKKIVRTLKEENKERSYAEN